MSVSTALADGMTDAEELMAPVPTNAQSQVEQTSGLQEKFGTVSVDRAFVRAAPSDESSRIMELPQGTVVPVESWNRKWYQIVTPTGVVAWINQSSLELN